MERNTGVSSEEAVNGRDLALCVLLPWLKRRKKACVMEAFFNLIQPLLIFGFYKMIMVAGGNAAENAGLSALKRRDKVGDILTGTDIHFSRNTSVHTMADTDIFDVSAAVGDEIQFLGSLFLTVAYFKFAAAARLLLKHIAASGRKDSGSRSADYRHILDDNLPAYAKAGGQVARGNRGFGMSEYL